MNLTDPSGKSPYPPEHCVFDPSSNIPYVEKHTNVSKSDWLNTYAVAGVAVQCWAIFIPNNDDYDGRGPAQITNKEKCTPCGVRIPDPEDPDNKKRNRGFGLLCNDEELHDQNEWQWAIEYMRRRIKLVTDRCIAAGCSSTDVYIAAALAQNGPGFTIFNLEDGLLAPKNRIDRDGITINWNKWFEVNSCRNASKQLRRFKDATDALRAWYMPLDVNSETIDNLKWTKICFP